jgi:hypothetical protein
LFHCPEDYFTAQRIISLPRGLFHCPEDYFTAQRITYFSSFGLLANIHSTIYNAPLCFKEN